MEAPAATAPTPSPLTTPPEATVPGGVITKRGAEQAFTVHLDNFEGPFDLLLGLISKHQLDITEIALAKVTDEFMVHLRALQASEPAWDLGQTSEFLLVAATLLDIKASRLLPNTGDGDEEDLELIEARDLLFARLMQYRAFKDVAAQFGETMAGTGRMTPRQAGLEPHLAALLPELVMSITPEQLAMIAARALTPKEPETIGLTHLHAPAVSVREQAVIVVDRLRAEGALSFRSLVRDADTTLVVVARFLALLELFRDKQVTFDQPEALGDLEVSWTGSQESTVDVGAEFDEGEPPPPSLAEEEPNE
ncbi:chromosome segregation protein ScpA [Janibacter sp. Soil728]|uniref:segregation and condensation protein A n=1 Tax=Janibacter sp. Soil728 TaxID=1736393 RepID=UPI0006FD0CE1|nr:ScpA family protein [Janibacter sp. Soil728]KRE37051.1 chromosome segregation protein ScpA [Janibacter sp. Soil728]